MHTDAINGRPAGFVARVTLATILSLSLACTLRPDTAPETPPPAATTLAYAVAVGEDVNHFVQSPQGAFHLLLSRQPRDRLVVASPAGNTGFALWFDRSVELSGSPEITGRESVSAKLLFTTPTEITDVALGSIRAVRDFIHGGSRSRRWVDRVLAKLSAGSPLATRLASMKNERWQISGDGSTATRITKGLEGHHRYRVQLTASPGTFAGERMLKIAAGSVTLLYDSTHEPLVPYAPGELLNDRARTTLESLPKAEREYAQGLLRALRFLTTRDKLLAGSWRFLTYFGRDTLISLRLLAPVLQPDVLEAGLASVAVRLSADGEVAHEESLAGQASKERLLGWVAGGANGVPPSNLGDAVFDRKMVDDDFLVLPLLMDYYFVGGRALFAVESPHLVALLRNVNRVVRIGLAEQLVPLQGALTVGDWRDSQSGLGYGRYPFSVNAVHLPAALEALATLLELQAWDQATLSTVASSNGLKALASILADRSRLTKARDSWNQIWKRFLVVLPAAERRRRLDAHRESLGIAPVSDRDPPYADGFLAVALDDGGQPIPILQGDIALMLLDLPMTDDLRSVVCAAYDAPFPDGLFTSAGVLVASGALAPTEKLRKMFDRDHYHGEVIWGWPQVALHVALLRRLGQWSSPPPGGVPDTSACVKRLEQKVRGVRRSMRHQSAGELWTWRVSGG